MKSVTATIFNSGFRDRVPAALSGVRLNALFLRFVLAVVIPGAALLVFLLLWSVGARNVETSLGQLPGPAKVWEQAEPASSRPSSAPG